MALGHQREESNGDAHEFDGVKSTTLFGIYSVTISYEKKKP
jgi:hypothetical protein